MTLKELKKLIKNTGVKQWVESGFDIIEIGDKLLGNKECISRLDYAAKHSEFNIYEDDIEIYHISTAHCEFGKIVLTDGKTIWYSMAY